VSQSSSVIIWAAPFPVDVATPVLPSLLSVNASADRVVLVWDVSGVAGTASIERHAEDEDWSVLATRTINGRDPLSYEDTSVRPGHRYFYRLGLSSDAGVTFTAETAVSIPVVSRLALDGAAPNPASRAFTVTFRLLDSAPASLELMDLAGRVITRESVAGRGLGLQTARLDAGAGIPPGVYFIRLLQHGHAAISRVAVAH